jgi:hypothetical protein
MATETQSLIPAVVALLEAELPALVTAQGLTAVTNYLAYKPKVIRQQDGPILYVHLSGLTAKVAYMAGTAGGAEEARFVTVGFTVTEDTPEDASLAMWGYADLIKSVILGEQDTADSYDVMLVDADMDTEVSDEGDFRSGSLVFRYLRDVNVGDL